MTQNLKKHEFKQSKALSKDIRDATGRIKYFEKPPRPYFLCLHAGK